MVKKDNFDEDEGFFDSLMQKRRESVPMPKSMSRLLKIIIGTGFIIVLSLIIWASWPDGQGNSDESVPIVRADTNEYKVEPEDRGGMPIPNKDSTIFEAMERNSEPEKKVESLLEDTEQPLKKEEVFVEGGMAEMPIADVSEPPSETIIPNKENIIEEKPAIAEKIEPVIAEEKPLSPVIEKVVEEKKVDVITTLKKDAGTDKPKPIEKPVAKGNTYIQLASVKSDADAKTKWTQLKSKYASLKPLNLRVNRADLGAKGIFFRVQAGPISADAAASTCAKIKSAGGDCLVVK